MTEFVPYFSIDQQTGKVNVPCSFCGRPTEGMFSIHDTSLMDGKEIPLCIQCGNCTRPTTEEIWDAVGRPMTWTAKPYVSEFWAPVDPAKIMSGAIARGCGKEAFTSCDCCGCQASSPSVFFEQAMFLEIGGKTPGCWMVTGEMLCKQCRSEINAELVYPQIVHNALLRNIPVKARIEQVWFKKVYGIGDWLASNGITDSLVRVKPVDAQPVLTPASLEKLKTGAKLVRALGHAVEAAEALPEPAHAEPRAKPSRALDKLLPKHGRRS